MPDGSSQHKGTDMIELSNTNTKQLKPTEPPKCNASIKSNAEVRQIIEGVHFDLWLLAEAEQLERQGAQPHDALREAVISRRGTAARSGAV